MFCFKCGQKIEEQSVFCRHCGVRITGLPGQDGAGSPGNADDETASASAGAIPLDESSDFIPASAEPGQGIAHYVLPGTWEAHANAKGGKLNVHFALAEDGSFNGWLERTGHFGRSKEKNDIEGTCRPVRDGNLLLGLELEVRAEGKDPFQLRIPIHRRVGSVYIGINDEGQSWSSHNIHPLNGD